MHQKLGASKVAKNQITWSILGTEGDVIELKNSSQNNELLFQRDKRRYYVLNLEDASGMPGDVVSPTQVKGENWKLLK